MSAKRKKSLTAIIIAAVVVALPAGAYLFGVRYYDRYANAEYAQSLDEAGVFSEGLSAAYQLPQTYIADAIMNHFKNPLPEGKTTKKALVIGYDGARADALKNAEDPDESGILTLKEMGGGVYPIFTGGPEGLEQDSSTAPGWASLLTGKWAGEKDGHKVSSNGDPKDVEPRTVLTRLAEVDKIKTADFITSWKGHLQNGGKTYAAEAGYTKEKGLDINWTTVKNDEETFETAKKQLEDGRDFVFLIFEHCDHAGHGIFGLGFGNQSKAYREAFKTSDAMGKSLIDTVTAMADYDKEDWLIVIASDHGGTGRSHGGPSVFERNVFAAANIRPDQE